MKHGIKDDCHKFFSQLNESEDSVSRNVTKNQHLSYETRPLRNNYFGERLSSRDRINFITEDPQMT